MMRIQSIWVVLCISTVVLAQSSYITIAEGMTTCHSSPAEINKPLDMTFTLPEDPNQTKRNFTVYRYNDHKVQDTVLRCAWPDDRLFCSVATGYTFGWKIARSFVLSVPSLTVNQTGFYACHLEGYPVENIKSCKVAVRQVLLSSPSHPPVIPDTSVVRKTSFTVQVTTDFLVSFTDNSRTDEKRTGVTSASCLSDSILYGYEEARGLLKERVPTSTDIRKDDCDFEQPQSTDWKTQPF